MKEALVVVVALILGFVGVPPAGAALGPAEAADVPEPLARAIAQLEAVGAPDRAIAKVREAGARVAASLAEKGGAPLAPSPRVLPDQISGALDALAEGCASPLASPETSALRVPHPPIAIRADADFTLANGVIAGDGSALNPYLIALWDVRGFPSALGGVRLPFETPISLDAAILIEGTTKHVRVRHVSIGAEPALSALAGDPDTPTLPGVVQSVAAQVFEGLAVPVGILVRDARNVVIENAIVGGTLVGVTLQGDVDVEVRCSLLAGNAWNGMGDMFEAITGGRVVIEGNTISSNGWGGTDFWEDTTASFEVIGNTFEGNGWAGLEHWGDFDAPVTVRIEDNTARANQWGGVEWWGDFMAPATLVARDNTFTDNEWSGYDTWGDFRAASTMIVEDNLATGNGWGGLEAWGDHRGSAVVRVVDNTASDNAWSGIDLWGDLQGGGTFDVLRNVANDNGWGGIEAWSGFTRVTAVVADNAAERNAWGGVEVWGRLTSSTLDVLRNRADDNDQAGVGVWGGASVGSIADVADNLARRNGKVHARPGGGLDVGGAVDATSRVRVHDNVADDNKYGLRLHRTKALIDANDVRGNEIGIHAPFNRFNPAPQPVITGNNVAGNSMFGLRNEYTVTIDARGNWWGDASGPGGAGPGTGDKVSAFVNYAAWLTAPA